jgi:2'-5' RNA ligase
MKKKYNLALTPISKDEEFINLSQEFSGIADKYLLGKNSMPHITLYQFEIEEEEIEHVWEKVSKEWEEKPINLQLSQFSCISFDNTIFWVSLLPNSTDILHEMHGKIATLLNLPIKKSFDPHLTLINTKNKDYEKEAAKLSGSYVPITDAFMLTLGKCDPIGQLTEIIHRYETAKKITYKV